MEPLQITATMVSPVAVPLFPVALDGLLAAVICERQGLIAGVGEFQHIEVPVKRSECGRYHLASVAHYESRASVHGYVNKRAPVVEYMHLGNDKIKSVNTGTGRNKAFRIPQPRTLVDCMRWWCIGDRGKIEPLLALVTHLGKKRSVGHGKVTRWDVERATEWPGFPVLRPDGTPLRNLPMDTPGLGPSTAVGWGPLSFPYWDQTAAVEVAQPPDTGWMGIE